MSKNLFWTGDTYAIVKAMRACGNRLGLITEWKDAVERWANLPEYMNLPDAVAVRAWLPSWRVRPFYTATELAPLWPMLALAVGWSDRPPPIRSPRRLEFELDYALLPYVISNGRKFYVVEQFHKWKDASEKDFENALG